MTITTMEKKKDLFFGLFGLAVCILLGGFSLMSAYDAAVRSDNGLGMGLLWMFICLICAMFAASAFFYCIER